VIQLDHRVRDQISTRRIRVVKYRGSEHGTNEYPFLIDAEGISVLPVTSLTLDHGAPTERISSGLESLDGMLGGKGFFKGSTILLSGTAGTGKTTLAAHFANAACRRGDKCLYFLFEESPRQMIRNMQSSGTDLAPWVEQGLLRFHADRPSRHGLETHLTVMHRLVEQFQPDVVVVDPITNLLSVGTGTDVRSMLTRLIDYFKLRETTVLFTSLTGGGAELETTQAEVSSLMDTWILATSEEIGRHRHRSIYVLKSRGMAHSDEVREFRFTDHGIVIAPERAEGAR
jgi:circadian clock protein KaiC